MWRVFKLVHRFAAVFVDLPVDLWQEQHIWHWMDGEQSRAMVVEIIKGKWKSHSVAIVIEFYSAIFSLLLFLSLLFWYFLCLIRSFWFISVCPFSLPHSWSNYGFAEKRVSFVASPFQWEALHATDYYHLNVGFSFTVFHFNHPLLEDRTLKRLGKTMPAYIRHDFLSHGNIHKAIEQANGSPWKFFHFRFPSIYQRNRSRTQQL